MPRLRFIEDQELDAERRALIASAERTGAPDPRVVRIMARSSAGVAWVKCWNSVLYEGKLPHRLKEMCRIRISVAHRCGYCSTGWQMPKSPAAPSNFSFDASQMIGQSQNVVNNNGNNAAFVSGITSTVSPIQQANNNINF